MRAHLPAREEQDDCTETQLRSMNVGTSCSMRIAGWAKCGKREGSEGNFNVFLRTGDYESR